MLARIRIGHMVLLYIILILTVDVVIITIFAVFCARHIEKYNTYDRHVTFCPSFALSLSLLQFHFSFSFRIRAQIYYIYMVQIYIDICSGSAQNEFHILVRFTYFTQIVFMVDDAHNFSSEMCELYGVRFASNILFSSFCLGWNFQRTLLLIAHRFYCYSTIQSMQK